MPASVVGIATALDKPALLELVEQPDQLPAVITERVGDRALVLARPFAEHDQDRVVVRVKARLLVRLHRPLLGRKAEALEQESGRRDELLGKPRNRCGGRCGEACSAHARNVSAPKRCLAV